MSLRRIFVATAIAFLSIAAIGSAGWVWLIHAPRRTPAGQPALARLEAQTLPAFRDAFNARAGQTRIVVLLSPT
jgi:hypothetical protein